MFECLLVAAIVIVLLVGLADLADSTAKHREFAKQYPLMSDDDFARRCGVKPEIAIGVRHALSDGTGVDPDEIHPDIPLAVLLEEF